MHARHACPPQSKRTCKKNDQQTSITTTNNSTRNNIIIAIMTSNLNPRSRRSLPPNPLLASTATKATFNSSTMLVLLLLCSPLVVNWAEATRAMQPERLDPESSSSWIEEENENQRRMANKAQNMCGASYAAATACGQYCPGVSFIFFIVIYSSSSR